MENAWLIVSLLREARNEWIAKTDIVVIVIIVNNSYHLLNPCCAQYVTLISATLWSTGEDVTVRDKTAVGEAERSDWLTSFLSS